MRRYPLTPTASPWVGSCNLYPSASTTFGSDTQRKKDMFSRRMGLPLNRELPGMFPIFLTDVAVPPLTSVTLSSLQLYP